MSAISRSAMIEIAIKTNIIKIGIIKLMIIGVTIKIDIKINKVIIIIITEVNKIILIAVKIALAFNFLMINRYSTIIVINNPTEVFTLKRVSMDRMTIVKIKVLILFNL